MYESAARVSDIPINNRVHCRITVEREVVRACSCDSGVTSYHVDTNLAVMLLAMAGSLTSNIAS